MRHLARVLPRLLLAAPKALDVRGHVAGQDFDGLVDILALEGRKELDVLALGLGHPPAIQGDTVVMRLVDMLFAFPELLLALVLVAILGIRLSTVVVAIGVVYAPSFARIVRGSVLDVREQPFVEAARCCGADDRRIIVRHVLPNVVAPIIVQTTLCFSFAILAEASLSYLGLGTPPPDPSWGRMLQEARQDLARSPWLAVSPSVALATTILGFNLLGDGLRDLFDPRLR